MTHFVLKNRDIFVTPLGHPGCSPLARHTVKLDQSTNTSKSGGEIIAIDDKVNAIVIGEVDVYVGRGQAVVAEPS